MKRNRLTILLGVAVIAFALLACDAGEIVALVSPTTPTPTRTPRPTFTPRPQFSPTPESSPTPEVTDTPLPTIAAPTRPPTAKPVVVAPKPTSPPPPPQPQLFHRDPGQGMCTTGSPVFEVKGRIKIGSTWAEGVHVIALDKAGKVVAQTNSWGELQLNPEWGVSCFQEKNLYNYQMDVSAGWFNGPLTLRLTKSATDLTPISTDEKLTFDATGGRYYIDWVK